MKIKVFDASTSGRLERKVNKFLADSEIKVLDIKHAGGFGFVSALITYEEAPREED